MEETPLKNSLLSKQLRLLITRVNTFNQLFLSSIKHSIYFTDGFKPSFILSTDSFILPHPTPAKALVPQTGCPNQGSKSPLVCMSHGALLQ